MEPLLLTGEPRFEKETRPDGLSVAGALSVPRAIAECGTTTRGDETKKIAFELEGQKWKRRTRS